MSDAASAIVIVLAVLLGLSVIPGIMWLRYRDEARARWPPRVVGTQVVHAAKYREAVVPTYGEEGTPLNVRIAAIGAWGLGQMFLPGLFLGLFGLLFVVGIVSIPGLILAWKNFFAGKSLLLGERGAEEKARRLAKFTVVLNVLVLAVVAGLSLWTLATSTSTLHDVREIVMLGGPVTLYAVISLCHAHFLRKAADEIEAHHIALDEGALSGVRVDVEPFSSQLGADELPANQSVTQPERGGV